MKRYALFQFDQYYPIGGWNDFKGSYDTPEDAQNALRSGFEYSQVIDLQTGICAGCNAIPCRHGGIERG